ncbi:uncharacterized protein EDB91DRAFT_1256734 [Suillus paluster]|uniref:uncharacterized protein n=1 Tax=Suillus paluster TaxID=48578 RepID=UPI001B85CDBF|nr:uncharacterized protein EDB91DRAFT_1256734 [Suillus paluster]KAG1720978.1 hypothetical protein EDB91DRAFT_1256734 [Suillus paluster]
MPSTGGRPEGTRMTFALPFESALEDMIEGTYEASEDRYDPEDTGDDHTRMVNMRVRRRMVVLSNGLNEILSQAFATLAIPGGCVDGQPANDNDAGGAHVAAGQRESGNRTSVETSMRDKASMTRDIWGLVRMARALRKEAEMVMKECALWDADSGLKNAHVRKRMLEIQLMAHKIMLSSVSILRFIGPAFERRIEMDRARRRAEKRDSCVWSVISMCRSSLEHVDDVLDHSLDW